MQHLLLNISLNDLHLRKNKRGFTLFYFYAFSYLVILLSSWYFSTFSNIGFWIISHLALLCFSVISAIIIKPRFLFNLRVFLKHQSFCIYCFSKDVPFVFNTKLCVMFIGFKDIAIGTNSFWFFILFISRRVLFFIPFWFLFHCLYNFIFKTLITR